jgi:hypothetical protein
MHIKILTWLAATLLLSGGVGLLDAGFQIVLQIVVCIAALLVFSQALENRKWVWMVVFLAISLTYNPVVPLHFSKRIFLWLDWMSLMTFMVSLVALKQRTRLSLVSVTNQNARPESL